MVFVCALYDRHVLVEPFDFVEKFQLARPARIAELCIPLLGSYHKLNIQWCIQHYSLLPNHPIVHPGPPRARRPGGSSSARGKVSGEE